MQELLLSGVGARCVGTETDNVADDDDGRVSHADGVGLISDGTERSDAHTLIRGIAVLDDGDGAPCSAAAGSRQPAAKICAEQRSVRTAISSTTVWSLPPDRSENSS